MAAMLFPCTGFLLIQGNLTRVIQLVFQMYRNIMLVFLSPNFPISISYFCLQGMVKLSVYNFVDSCHSIQQYISAWQLYNQVDINKDINENRYYKIGRVVTYNASEKRKHIHLIFFKQIQFYDKHLHSENTAIPCNDINACLKKFGAFLN